VTTPARGWLWLRAAKAARTSSCVARAGVAAAASLGLCVACIHPRAPRNTPLRAVPGLSVRRALFSPGNGPPASCWTAGGAGTEQSGAIPGLWNGASSLVAGQGQPPRPWLYAFTAVLAQQFERIDLQRPDCSVGFQAHRVEADAIILMGLQPASSARRTSDSCLKAREAIGRHRCVRSLPWTRL